MAQFASTPISFAISIILLSSFSDSMLIEKIFSFRASWISALVFPTPENTMFFGSAPAKRHRLSSLPDTTSNPDPISFKSFRILILELDLTAKQTLSSCLNASLYSKNLDRISDAE